MLTLHQQIKRLPTLPDLDHGQCPDPTPEDPDDLRTCTVLMMDHPGSGMPSFKGQVQPSGNIGIEGGTHGDQLVHQMGTLAHDTVHHLRFIASTAHHQGILHMPIETVPRVHHGGHTALCGIRTAGMHRSLGEQSDPHVPPDGRPRQFDGVAHASDATAHDQYVEGPLHPRESIRRKARSAPIEMCSGNTISGCRVSNARYTFSKVFSFM